VQYCKHSPRWQYLCVRSTRRLDFSFVEFDMSKLEALVVECWEFDRAFKQRTGWAPGGYGIYFIDRSWAQQQDPKAPQRPCGNFSGSPGWSFQLDPYTGDCDAPRVRHICCCLPWQSWCSC
jgi:hypothetical protein